MYIIDVVRETIFRRKGEKMLSTIGTILVTVVAFTMILASQVCTLAVQVYHAVAPMVVAGWQYVSVLVA